MLSLLRRGAVTSCEDFCGGGEALKKRSTQGLVAGREAVRARMSVRRLEDS